jgi:hypothetical protein
MQRAVEEYFPTSNIYNDLDVNGDGLDARDEESAAQNDGQTYPLQRVNTGVASLVGSTNGQRPGGYILVIDGLALTDVSFFCFAIFPLLRSRSLMGVSLFDRLSRMSVTAAYFFVLRRCVRVCCVAVCPRNRRRWWSTWSETISIL